MNSRRRGERYAPHGRRLIGARRYTAGIAPMPARPKLLVFIVAYEAESTLEKVIARVPDEVFERTETKVVRPF